MTLMSVGRDSGELQLESYMFLDQAKSFRDRLREEQVYSKDEKEALEAANDEIGSLRNLINWWREIDSAMRSYCTNKGIEAEDPDISNENSMPALTYRKAVATLQNANEIMKDTYDTDLREITERELEYGNALQIESLEE